MSQLFDPVRRLWVAATPEEKVRQQWIQYLFSLGYPIEGMAVEKSLEEIKGREQLLDASLNYRRLDLCCSRVTHTGLEPLLLAEFKSTSLSSDDWRQLLGYNAQIRAPLLLLANDRVFWCQKLNDNGNYQTIQAIPPYSL